MDKKELVAIQENRGAKNEVSTNETKKFDIILNDCRRYIQDHTKMVSTNNIEIRRANIKDSINSYVMNLQVLVEGFISDNNTLDTNRLIDKLVEDITDYGILTSAILDPDIYEIRCNGKEVKVEIKGKVQDLYNQNGELITFSSVEQQDIILRKLLGDVRLTPKDAIVNSITMEGFRIAAVHSSALSLDPSLPTNNERYHAFVLRKFKKNKMSLNEIVRFGTMSDNMARFLSLLPSGGLTFFTVGPTASGKTTLNNAILQEVPPTTRTVLLQNPSEIDLRMKDTSGRVYNDVLHLEAKEIESPTPKDPTMENLMAHILRLSPTFVCFGELRKNAEFKLGLQIGQAGHPLNCTFHAENSEGAIRRYLTAYLSESGNEPSHLALRTLTDLVQVIIVQKIMRDGTRKVLQITEVLGVDEKDPNKPLLNDIYVYNINKEPTVDMQGNVIKINGEHKRVGTLSQRTIEKFKREGVPTSKYDFLLAPVDTNEKETYNGDV